MPVKISPRKVDLDTEKKIMTGMIVSTGFIKDIIYSIHPKIFKTPYAQRVCKWIIDYYNQYKEAPRNNIKDIYEVEKKRIDEKEAELIADFLDTVSSEFVKNESQYNAKYHVDKYASPYIKARSLEDRVDRVKNYLNLGRIDEAEHELVAHKKIVQVTSGWQNPLDVNFIQNAMEVTQDNILFYLPGKLGDISGPIERGKLYGVQGSAKGGKSFFSGEIRTLGLMNRYKVAEYNFEMKETLVANRFYKRITAQTNVDGKFLYPVLDCEYNQNGECEKHERKSEVDLIDDTGFKPEWGEHHKNYIPCTECRGTRDYKLATWFEEIYRDKISIQGVKKKANAFKLHYGENWHLKSFPKFGGTIGDIERDLDIVEYANGFVPDILIVDYPGIIKSEERGSNRKEQLSTIWKSLGRIASERSCAIIAPAQTNREGAKKKRGDVTDIGEDWGIIADVDGIWVINQTDAEKKAGIVRISVGALREGSFNKEDSVCVLQNINLGQVILDSEI